MVWEGAGRPRPLPGGRLPPGNGGTPGHVSRVHHQEQRPGCSSLASAGVGMRAVDVLDEAFERVAVLLQYWDARCACGRADLW